MLILPQKIENSKNEPRGTKGKETYLPRDDSELNRAILADMLDDEYEIIEAEDGLQGVGLLQQVFWTRWFSISSVRVRTLRTWRPLSPFRNSTMWLRMSMLSRRAPGRRDSHCRPDCGPGGRVRRPDLQAVL
mgnify:CR=1 FL=1